MNGALSSTTGWTITGGFRADSAFSTTNGRSNPGYGYLAAADGTLASSNNLAGTIGQTVTIPGNATAASLTYYYKHSTNETVANADSLSLRLKSTGGTVLTTLQTTYNQTSPDYVAAGPFNVLSYAGQTVVVEFIGATNATGPTVFRIDDVSLSVTTPDPSTGTPVVPVSPGHPSQNAAVNYPVDSLSPGFRWNAVSGATGYGIQVDRTTNAGASWTSVYNSETAFGTTMNVTSFSLPLATTTGLHRWRVRAFIGGVAQPYSTYLYTNVTTPTTRMLGVDVSGYQGTINWTSVKNAGINFAFTKATEGATFVDSPTFANNMTNARAAGVAIGAYHFARPNNPAGTNDAPDEAAAFVSTISPYLLNGNLHPVLDMEDNGGLGKAALSTWTNTFCSEVFRLTGLAPIIYTGQSFASTYLDASVLKYPLWVAQYPNTTPNPQTATPAGTSPWSTWHFWQYTSTGTVSGISGNVDRNTMNGGASALEQYKIFNTATGVITGTLRSDTNQNNSPDATEPGIPGRTVYADLNGDGALTAGEPSSVTNSSGVYTLNGLKPGGYVIRQVLPTGWIAAPVESNSVILNGGATYPLNFGSRSVDTVAPTVTASSYSRLSDPQLLSFTFSESVQASLASGDLVVTRDGSPTSIAGTLLNYNTSTNQATFSVPLYATGVAGRYAASFAAGSVTDASGNPLGAIAPVAMPFQPGDVTGDAVVNFDDLLALAANYGQSGTTIDQGDLNYDGDTNFDDLLILAANYGTSLPAAPAQAPAPLVAPGPDDDDNPGNSPDSVLG